MKRPKGKHSQLHLMLREMYSSSCASTSDITYSKCYGNKSQKRKRLENERHFAEVTLSQDEPTAFEWLKVGPSKNNEVFITSGYQQQ